MNRILIAIFHSSSRFQGKKANEEDKHAVHKINHTSIKNLIMCLNDPNLWQQYIHKIENLLYTAEQSI